MLFSRLSPLLWAGLAAISHATPMPMDVAIPLGQEATELEMRRAIEKVTQVRHLEKRLTADFRMDKSWKNQVLFAGNWGNNDPHNANQVSLAITCLECYTKGNVRTKLFENIFDPKVRLDFTGVEAYVNLNIAMSAGATYAVNLFTSNTPIGLGFPGLSVGVVFYVDLVFSLTEEINLDGGFYVKVADNAFLEASVFGGDITDSFFNGLQSHSLPVTVHVGRATFKANLRLRVQCGAEADLDIFGIGAGAVMGVYANVIEFVAVLETTSTCPLQARQWWDMNVGAYARLNVVVDYTTIGFVPTVSTTLLSAPTATLCLIGGGSGGGGGGGVGGSASGSPSVTGLPPPPTTTTFAAVTSRQVTHTVTTPSTLLGGSSTRSTLLSTTRTASPSIPLSTVVASSGSISLSASSSGRFNNATTTSAPSQPDLVTSTIYSTIIYTVTACAAGVVNCPASYQQEIVVTQTVQAFTTVCPADATITEIPPSLVPTTSTTAVPVPSDLAVLLVVTDMVVLAPCATPIIETYIPPATLPTPVVQHIDAAAPTDGLFGGAFLALPTSPAGAGSGFGVKDVKPSSSSSVAIVKPSSNSTSPSGAAQGTGKPSASYSPSAGATKPVTAGAADRAASFVAVLIALGGAVALL